MLCKENIVAVIGDGSLSGGEAFEGFDMAAEIGTNMIIVVNDNGAGCRDSAQIITPFMRVRTYLTRNFATLGPL